MKHQIESALKMVKPVVLEFGDYSLNVMRLQRAMNALGFYQGSIDGYFGTMTLEALNQMQGYLDIEPSQRFELKTWEALNHWLPTDLHRTAFNPPQPISNAASRSSWLVAWRGVGSLAIS